MVDFNHYVELATPLLDKYGYFALFGAIFVEGFGIPAPGQTLLIASSILAGRGELNITAVVVVAWLAAVLGNSVGYAIGAWGGKKLFYKIGFSPSHFAKVEHYFEKHGGWMIVGARFFEGLRQLNGIVAGSMGMPWLRFSFYNMLGATLWVAFWGLGTYWASEHTAAIAHALKVIEPYVIVMAAIAFSLVLAYILTTRSFSPKTFLQRKPNQAGLPSDLELRKPDLPKQENSEANTNS